MIFTNSVAILLSSLNVCKITQRGFFFFFFFFFFIAFLFIQSLYCPSCLQDTVDAILRLVQDYIQLSEGVARSRHKQADGSTFMALKSLSDKIMQMVRKLAHI